MLNALLMVVAFLMLLIGIRILMVLRNSKQLPAEKMLKRQSGIFIEHGMVRATGRNGVEADKKLSEVYYHSVS